MEEFLTTITDKKLNEKLETILKISGVTKENIFISLVTHLLKVSQYLVKNKGIFLIGENGTGKSYIYTEFFKELFPKYSGSMITPALLIGDGRATPNDTECIFDEKAVLIEEICDDDESSQSSIGILKDTLESGYFKKCKKENKGINISPVFTGNDYNQPNNLSDLISCKDSIPKRYRDKGFLDRVPLLLPHNKKLFGEMNYYKNVATEEFSLNDVLKNLRENLKEKNYITTDMEISSEREEKIYNSFLNAITTLLYPNEKVPDWFIRGWFELLKFFRSLLIDEKVYNPFNEKSARLIIEIIGYDIDNIDYLVFTTNRLIVKPKEENNIFKIALTGFGIEENQKEYNFYQSNKNSFISPIIEITKTTLTQKVGDITPDKRIYLDPLNKSRNEENKTDEEFNYSILQSMEYCIDRNINFDNEKFSFRGIPDFYKYGLSTILFNAIGTNVPMDKIKFEDFILNDEDFKILNFVDYLQDS